MPHRRNARKFKVTNHHREADMSKILIVYATHDGQTAKICQVLQQELQQTGQDEVELSPIDTALKMDLTGYDKIVVGASIRYGKHKPIVTTFIKQHQNLLDSKPNAFFSVNVVARKPNKNTPASNPYMQKFLRRISWRPKQLAVFAGRIDYPSLTVLDRNIIRFIMLITRGPTDPTGTFEFTDWQKVKAFAETIRSM